MKKRKKEIQPTRVPTPLCIFFVIFIGACSIFIACNFPGKVTQYQIRENLVENGEVVNAVFEKAWINEDYVRPKFWDYRIKFSYVDSNNVNYSITIRSSKDTDIESLEGTTIKILIDGKGNCIREGTTKGNLITDILLYVLMWLFFTCWWIPFFVFLIKNLRYYVYRHKLKKQEENPDYSKYFK